VVGDEERGLDDRDRVRVEVGHVDVAGRVGGEAVWEREVVALRGVAPFVRARHLEDAGAGSVPVRCGESGTRRERTRGGLGRGGRECGADDEARGGGERGGAVHRWDLLSVKVSVGAWGSCDSSLRPTRLEEPRNDRQSRYVPPGSCQRARIPRLLKIASR